MTKKYYKVVASHYDDTYSSAIQLSSRLRLYYVPGEWIEPKVPGSKIFLFKTLEDAQRFAKDKHKDWEKHIICIFECEAKGVSKDGPMGSRHYFIDTFIELCLRRKHKKAFKKKLAKEFGVQHAPRGTVFADSVRLIDKVQTVHHGRSWW
jgi:hypothetical protein